MSYEGRRDGSQGARVGGAALVDGAAGVPGKTTLVEQTRHQAAGAGNGTTGLPYLAVGQGSQAAPATSPASAIDPPTGGVNQPGFIDNSDGANLRTGPREAGGNKVIDAPLPPATRVFVSGTHPSAPEWWYVTAFLPDKIVRGYVQYFRVTTDLPEPLAKLHHVKSGDTAEGLAVQEYKSSVRDGHDLRFYENVLLYVNQQRGRAGITGRYQAPGIFGGGANNIQLVAGHRIWLVSPAYARDLEDVVPDGSLTNGAYAKVKRFVQHVRDLLASVTESPNYFGEVAGDYAQAIRDHLPAIIGIVAGFIAAEAISMFAAATPTGVGQAAAAVIQLALSAFGAAGMIEAGLQALQHAGQWLTLAWTAHGDAKQIADASREFLRMLVSIAMAALGAMGAKANYGKAVKIANSIPPAGLAPAFATAGGPAHVPTATTGTAVKLGAPGPAGPVGTAGMMIEGKEEGGGDTNKADAKEPVAPGRTPAKGGAGRLIVPAGRTLSAEEAEIANMLVAEGRVVEAVPESTSRTADFLVDGVPTELKTISKITGKDPSASLSRRILDGAGQAQYIIVDLRGQAGMTKEVAQRAVYRAYGADGRIQTVRLIGRDFDDVVTRRPPPASNPPTAP